MTTKQLKQQIRDLRIQLHQTERRLLAQSDDQSLAAQILTHELSKHWAPWSSYLG